MNKLEKSTSKLEKSMNKLEKSMNKLEKSMKKLENACFAIITKRNNAPAPKMKPSVTSFENIFFA